MQFTCTRSEKWKLRLWEVKKQIWEVKTACQAPQNSFSRPSEDKAVRMKRGGGQSPQASSVEWMCLSEDVVLGVGKMKQPMFQQQKLMFKYVISKVKCFKKYTL